ncbi:ASCH domain-containing protein [Salmonella enterica]|nr:ASCH domain-containing protein [Salmonella enterica]EAT5483084.1 ASCH domain-containing protein [Salmonella enterica]EBJ9876826.1 ASCH domain-containing protein [Salmonella enterica]EBU3041851.1 ASCH domain-containing protein [Salmonella enterica]ECX4156197.1 ASCH domain-containing protein [Salmonella enterica]
MKERGMIFNGEMVRAILDGRKTQTRRVMKVQPEPSKTREGDYWFPSKKLECMVHISDIVPGNSPIADCHLFFQEHCCPFGAVGDRIWVRETWAEAGAGAPDLKLYRANYPEHVPSHYENVPKAEDIRWTPSIHMPRVACRILLEITDVRVERLNDISQEDAQAEGMELTGWRPTYSDPDSGGDYQTPYDNFAELWESIYGEGSWQTNPWVWVIEFKRIEGGEA